MKRAALVSLVSHSLAADTDVRQADESEEPLLEDDNDADSRSSVARQSNVNIWQLLRAKELRKPLLIVTIMMTTQQSSGMFPLALPTIVTNALSQLAGINASKQLNPIQLHPR